MPFQQSPLPFEMNAMKPFLSEEQLTYHHGKHHAGYFKNLNTLVEGKPEADMSLGERISASLYHRYPRRSCEPGQRG